MATNNNDNVRRITSKLLLRYNTMLEEGGKSWKDVDWEEFELESGPGGSTGNTTLKIINSCPVWKEVFEEQRKGIEPTFCDVQIHGSDGYILAHSIYLQHASGLVDSLIKSPPGGDRPSPQKVLGVTLSDVKVDHIRTVLSLLYCGVAVVHQSDRDIVRYVMDILQINNLALEEDPLSTGGAGPNRIQQVLIYRLRETGGVNEETDIVGETPVSLHRGDYLPVLPLPAPPPPPPILSGSAARLIENASIAAVCEAVATAGAAAIPVKNRISSQSVWPKRKKVAKAHVSRRHRRYPKRSSLPTISYKEVDEGDFFTSGVGKGDEQQIRKKIKTEVKVKQETTSEDKFKTPEKSSNSKCHFCVAQFETEDELEDHLEEKCGRILDGYYDLQSRFCNACKLSYKNYDASEFIEHVSTCLNLRKKRRGPRRGSNSTNSTPVKGRDGDSLVYSDEDCCEPAEPQVLEPSGEEQVTLEDSEEGMESTPIVIKTVTISPFNSISQGHQSSASNSTVNRRDNESLSSVSPNPLQRVGERSQQTKVVATVPQPKQQFRPIPPVKRTGGSPIMTKNFNNRKVIVYNNRSSNSTTVEKKSSLPASSPRTAPAKRSVSYVAPSRAANVVVEPITPPAIAPPPINVVEEATPMVYYGPGGKTLTEIVVIQKHGCPRCNLFFQSETQLRSHMNEGNCW